MADTEQAKEQAKEQVQGAAQQAKGKLSEQVDQRSTQAGQQVSTMAEDVRSVAQELRTQGKDTPARYAEQAADKVQGAGRWLEQSDGDKLLRDVEDFARRKPWAVAAGGLVLGLAASRMLKASSSERYRAGVSNGTASRQLNGAGSAEHTLAAEPTAAGAATTGTDFERRPEGSMVSTEPRS